jgi:hypothetical protein
MSDLFKRDQNLTFSFQPVIFNYISLRDTVHFVLPKNFLLYCPNNTTIYKFCMDFCLILLHICCVIQPSTVGMLVHRKKSVNPLLTRMSTNLLSIFTHNRQRINTIIKTAGKATQNKQELLQIVYKV